jgi:hypothetical protein
MQQQTGIKKSGVTPTQLLKVTDGTPIALKFKGPEDERFTLIANVEERSSQYGAFLVNPVPEAERATSDSYFITPHSNGKDMNLRVKRAGAASDAKAEQICVLFSRKYDDGSLVYKGKDKATEVRYLVGVSKFGNKQASTADAQA